MTTKLTDYEVEHIALHPDSSTYGALATDLLETRHDARTLAMMIAHQDIDRAGMALLAKWIKDAIEHGFDPSEIGGEKP